MLAMARSAKENQAKFQPRGVGGAAGGAVQGGVSVRSFWWGNDVTPLLSCRSAGSGDVDGGHFDVVIVADCIYNPSLHEPLLRSCHQLLRRGKTKEDESGAVLVAFSLHPNTSHESVFAFFDVAASAEHFDPPFVVTKLLERQCTPHESNAHAAESNLRSYVWVYKMTLPALNA
jgi:predicted nicotinamide N-methyase